MDKFEEAICGHNPLYKEGLQDKYYQGAKWAWQSRQAEVEEKDKRIKELENRIEEGLGFIDKFHCEGWLPDLDNAEKALRGEHE